jgi:hypothetical protein
LSLSKIKEAFHQTERVRGSAGFWIEPFQRLPAAVSSRSLFEHATRFLYWDRGNIGVTLSVAIGLKALLHRGSALMRRKVAPFSVQASIGLSALT